MMRRWLVMSVFLALLLAGCGGGTKETVALVAVLTPPEQIADRTDIPLVLMLEPFNSEERVSLNLEASGPISVNGQTEYHWENTEAHKPLSIQFSVRAEGAGQGELVAKVLVTSASGQMRYGINPRIYFLATPEEVLAGETGGRKLEVEHLDHLLKQHRISLWEYVKRYRQLSAKRAYTD